MIAGRASATKLIVLVAIVLAVLAFLAVLALQRRRTPELPNPPVHTRNRDGEAIISTANAPSHSRFLAKGAATPNRRASLYQKQDCRKPLTLKLRVTGDDEIRMLDSKPRAVIVHWEDSLREQMPIPDPDGLASNPEYGSSRCRPDVRS